MATEINYNIRRALHFTDNLYIYSNAGLGTPSDI